MLGAGIAKCNDNDNNPDSQKSSKQSMSSRFFDELSRCSIKSPLGGTWGWAFHPKWGTFPRAANVTALIPRTTFPVPPRDSSWRFAGFWDPAPGHSIPVCQGNTTSNVYELETKTSQFSAQATQTGYFSKPALVFSVYTLEVVFPWPNGIECPGAGSQKPANRQEESRGGKGKVVLGIGAVTFAALGKVPHFG